MKLTSFDIKHKEFGKTFRGFDPEEVNRFLEELASEWEEYCSKCDELTLRITVLETETKNYKSMEKALELTFLQAQETSGKVVGNARKEAHLIIQEAELKAAQILEKAHNELTSLKEHAIILKSKKDSMVSRLRILLNSELDLIRALEIEAELQDNQKEERQEKSHEKAEIEEILKHLNQV